MTAIIKKINNILVVSVFFFITASFAFAADYNLLQPIKNITTVGGANAFEQYLSYFIPFILGLAAVLAVVQIVIGGVHYALSEAIPSKADAKDRMTSALYGLLLALASYLILNTINPNLVSLRLDIPPIEVAPTSSINLNTTITV